ncbi:hypothetical protein ETAA8_39960 [Anatilimnocola aggregata]|uniref:DUF2924 domain-containing protein n=1 Tax=Anatilimnocola aggregata TaxID=2528021 RepID=A0A517YF89_9BACT|nr:DUF2924 domain-containing protein [Anatilimnocola aggregata]QDU28890.1 hypothetical protein ETAA8_39960 [Anatilimnocola aggregata]
MSDRLRGIEAELAKLPLLTVGELRNRFIEVFGEPTNSRHKDWLVKRIAWRMQANLEGGLSERALARAKELANEADLRIMAPRKPGTSPGTTTKVVACPVDARLPPPGSVIKREYKGQTLLVTVRHEGFEFEGQTFASLTAIAKSVTGQHWNGYVFFGLGKGAK